jgi:hypothetical protein
MNPVFYGDPHTAFYGITIKDTNNLTFNQNLLNSKIIPEFIKFRTLPENPRNHKTPPLPNHRLLPLYCLPAINRTLSRRIGRVPATGSRQAVDAKT